MNSPHLLRVLLVATAWIVTATLGCDLAATALAADHGSQAVLSAYVARG